MQIILNGKVMNECQKIRPDHGKIMFKSEGAEVFFRKIDLEPFFKGR